MVAFLFPFLAFFFLCPFFLDASTMEVTTSPNKKNDNKLHWIRMSGWRMIQQEWMNWMGMNTALK